MIDKQDVSEEEQIKQDYEPLIPDLCRGEGLFAVVIIAELMAILTTVADSGLGHFNWQLMAQSSLVALWIALLSALGLCLGRHRLSSLGNKKAAGFSFLLIIVVSLLCGAVAELLIWYQASVAGESLFDFWAVLDYLVLTAIPAGILLRYLFLQQQIRINQKAELSSRIQALQSRIRPHFLFNTMNVIASLITTDPEKAEKAVEDVSDLFRNALTDTEVLVPLRSELSLCRRYLALEKLRLGDRLVTQWEIGDYGESAKVPALSLQPLVENAIYHGIQLLPEGGEVAVTVSGKEDHVEIVIVNPLIRVQQQQKGHRMAMKNVSQRLDAHFGDKAWVTAEPGEDKFVTTMVVPLGEVRRWKS